MEALVLTPQEAFAAIATCAMYADDHLEGDEDDAMLELLQRLPEFDGMTPAGVREVLVRVVALIRRHGEDGLVEVACASLPSQRRTVALEVARAICAADGEHDEGDFLVKLRARLG